MREFYVYIHRKMDTGEIFYVGKGKGSRYKDSSSRNKHWKHIVNKHGFAYEIIKDNWFRDEKKFLELFGEKVSLNEYLNAHHDKVKEAYLTIKEI